MLGGVGSGKPLFLQKSTKNTERLQAAIYCGGRLVGSVNQMLAIFAELGFRRNLWRIPIQTFVQKTHKTPHISTIVADCRGGEFNTLQMPFQLLEQGWFEDRHRLANVWHKK